VEFGVITQSAMAFSHLLGAFSLIVTQFQAISSYAAVLARLSVFAEAAEAPTVPEKSGIETIEDRDRVAFERLTLHAPHDDRVLVRELTAVLPYGRRVLVHGPDELACVALVGAVAGLWTAATGRVVRPPLAEVGFLPERPYVPPGTLREALRDPDGPSPSDDEVHRALHAVGVDDVVARSGGLDVERDWARMLSLSDQQLVAIARVLLARPRFAFFDHPGRTLDESRVGALLDVLSARGITCVVVGDVGEPVERYDARLELAGDGRWRWEGSPMCDAG
jgi:putative ATP-binding cassette transporter